MQHFHRIVRGWEFIKKNIFVVDVIKVSVGRVMKGLMG